MTITNQKPIDHDIHLKYKCPNSECGIYHWLSLKEAKTPHFLMVCDCGTVFESATVNDVNITFLENNSGTNLDFQNECIRILVNYGLSETESAYLFNKASHMYKADKPISLVRYILQNIGELNECN